jgi:hypothetical protein
VVLHIDSLKVDGAVDFLVDLAKRPCFQTTEETLDKLKEMLAVAKTYRSSFQQIT